MGRRSKGGPAAMEAAASDPAKPEPEKRKRGRLVDNDLFNAFFLGLIFVNAAQRGLELELDDDGVKIFWTLLDHFFTVCFLIEMIIKIWSLKKTYFQSAANWIDFVVVIAMVVDNWLISLIADDGPALRTLSVFRCLRLVVLLRLFKARSEIKLIMEGTLSALWSLVWVAMLVGLAIYTGAVFFVTFIGKSDAYPAGELDQVKYFGDLSNAMVTGLNLALLSDSDWSSVLRPIVKRQPLVAVAICAYVAISSLCIVNAIIGVIVTQASQTIRQDELDIQAKQKRLILNRAETVKDLLYADGNADAVVSVEQIAIAALNDQLNRTIRALDFPTGYTVADLHCMLDNEGEWHVPKQEFGQGMRTLFSSNDFQRHCSLTLALANQRRKLFDLKCHVEDQFDLMNTKIDSLPEKFAEVLADANLSLRTNPCSPRSDAQYASERSGQGRITRNSTMDQAVKIVPDAVAEDASGLAFENQLSPHDIPGYIGDPEWNEGPDGQALVDTSGNSASKQMMAATTGGAFLRAPGQADTDNTAEASQALAVPGDGNSLRNAAASANRTDGFNNVVHPGLVGQQVTQTSEPYVAPPLDTLMFGQKHFSFAQPAAGTSAEQKPATPGDAPSMDPAANIPGQIDSSTQENAPPTPAAAEGAGHPRTPVKKRDIVTISVV